MSIPMLLFYLPFISTLYAAPSEDQWRVWANSRDQDLKKSDKSYLSVTEIVFLQPGVTLFLPSDASRKDCKWRKNPGDEPSIKLSFADGKALVSPVIGEPVNLLDAKKWSTPNGLILTADLFSDRLLRVITHDPDHPILKGFSRTPYFPFNPAAVINGQLKRVSHPQKVKAETTQGAPREVWLVGDISFTYEAHSVSLQAFSLESAPNGNHLFITFKDLSNGKETYGGGRYLEAEVDGPEATEVMLDFNRSYNPLCARNHVYNCIRISGKPLPVQIRAGEMAP